MATTKKAGKKKKGKRTKFAAGGDPIVIGGGGGGLKRRGAATGGTTIKFNPGWYDNPRDPHEHGHAGEKLAGLDISVGGGRSSPPVGPNADVEVWCRRPPATIGAPVFWLSGKDLTFEFSGDFVRKSAGKYNAIYLRISEVYVNGDLVFTSSDGDCEISAQNTLTRLKAKKKKRTAPAK